MRNIGILSLFIIILLSCSEEINTKEFYFNPSNFKTPKTYTFKSLENPSKVQYWKISNTSKNGIFTIRNNSKKQLIDELKEEITENGSNLISYFKSHSYQSEWIQNLTFYPKVRELIKWDLKEKSIYEGEFIIDGIIWSLKREREFIEKSEIEFQSDRYEVLIFKDKYELESLTNPNQKQKIWYSESGNNFVQYSYFSKGIGMVKFKREYDNGKVEIMKLVEIN